MSAEVLIALIQKDIKELDIIAQGLYETEQPSPMILSLASEKAQSLVDNLKQLSIEKFNKLSDLKDNEKYVVSKKLEQKVIDKKPTFQIEENQKEKKSGVISGIFSKTLKIGKDTESSNNEIEKPVLEEIKQSNVEEKQSVISKVKEESEPVAKSKRKIIRKSVSIENIEKSSNSEPKKTVSYSKPLIERAEKKESKAEKIIGKKETKISLVSKVNDNSLASALAHKKVDDLRKLNMADRYRYLRELFNNNINLMSDTLIKLNGFKDIKEAEIYLSENFDWDSNDETVSDFLSLVARHFI